MENLIILSVIAYSLYLVYLAATDSRTIADDVRENYEEYKKTYWIGEDI